MSHTVEGCWRKVKEILENDSTLGSYVKKVYEGSRDNIPKSNYPCIVMEPRGISERDISIPEQVEAVFTITLLGVIEIYDKEKQIVGDDSTKGIVDLMLDIKRAFGKDTNLSGNCIYFEFPDTRFDLGMFYPLRGVEIDMAIHLRQNFRTRA